MIDSEPIHWNRDMWNWLSVVSLRPVPINWGEFPALDRPFNGGRGGFICPSPPSIIQPSVKFREFEELISSLVFYKSISNFAVLLIFLGAFFSGVHRFVLTCPCQRPKKTVFTRETTESEVAVPLTTHTLKGSYKTFKCFFMEGRNLVTAIDRSILGWNHTGGRYFNSWS